MKLLSSRCLRPVAFLALLWAGGTCVGQGKEKSLTRDFDRLSAKERSRIAAQETVEADRDTLYQRLMREGDQAFRAGRFEDALAIFEDARQLRPYNVYPKVKIEDLQALIAKREREAALAAPPPPEAEMPTPETIPPTEESPTLKPPTVEPVIEAPVVEEIAPPAPPVIEEPEAPLPPSSPAPVMVDEEKAVDPPMPPAPPRVEPPVQRTVPPPAIPQQTETSEPEPAVLVPGERIYLEAGAVVTERTIEEEGKLVVYKRVAHSWGQTFYFREGLSIPERRWAERFSTMDH